MKELEMKLEKERKAHEEDIIKKIREEESQRQNLFEKKLKEKLSEARENLVLTKRKRAEEKKKKIGFSSVAKSMSSLMRRIEEVNEKNEIRTPDSSDIDSPKTGIGLETVDGTQEENVMSITDVDMLPITDNVTVVDGTVENNIVDGTVDDPIENNTDNITIDISENKI